MMLFFVPPWIEPTEMTVAAAQAATEAMTIKLARPAVKMGGRGKPRVRLEPELADTGTYRRF